MLGIRISKLNYKFILRHLIPLNIILLLVDVYEAAVNSSQNEKKWGRRKSIIMTFHFVAAIANVTN